LARVYKDTSRLNEAADALNAALAADPPAPWWTVAWLSGEINLGNGHFDEAIANFEQVLDPANLTQQEKERKFDFSLDYVVINDLGQAFFRRSQLEKDDVTARDQFLQRAVEQFERTLEIDSEDLDAHFGLYRCYTQLAESAVPAAGTAAE